MRRRIRSAACHIVVSARRLGLVMILVGLAAGCAGRPDGVMMPVAPDESGSARTVDMLVATTRAPSSDPAILYTGERSPTLHLTDIAVSIPGNRSAGTVQWPRRLPPNPETDFAIMRTAPVSTVKEVSNWFTKYSVDGHVLLFVHGFNNKFADSVFRLAQIVNDSGARTTPVLFTWPSRASVLDYNYDKESTNYSRTALEDLLRSMAKAPDVKDVTILAHSMGTWLTMEALRQMAIRDGHVASKIENVVLASPDIDLDVFMKQWTELGKPGPKFTIFVSQDDRALALSSLISGKVTRLGRINPTAEPYRTQLEKAGITAIDLTKIKTESSLHHSKFAESPEIVQVIGQRLLNGQILTDSTTTVGDGIVTVVSGAAAGVGSIASATISAPVRILESSR